MLYVIVSQIELIKGNFPVKTHDLLYLRNVNV